MINQTDVMKLYKQKIKTLQKHYGDPQWDLDDHEYDEIKSAEENDECDREMADDDKRDI